MELYTDHLIYTHTQKKNPNDIHQMRILKVHSGRWDRTSPDLFEWRLLSILAEITGQYLEDPSGKCITSRGGVCLLIIGNLNFISYLRRKEVIYYWISILNF